MPKSETEKRTDQMRDKLKMLAQVIVESPEFVAYEEAQKKLKESEEAQRLIREFQAEERKFRMFGGFGNVDDQSKWQKAQDAMAANPEVRALVKSQEELTEMIRAANRIIGKNLGFDFGQACAPVTGCC